MDQFTVEDIQQAQDYAGQLLSTAKDSSRNRYGYVQDSWLNAYMQLLKQKFDNDQQFKLWELNNEYNTPANQMARFKEAGLNPMLIYSQGTPGNSNSPAGYSTANFQLSPSKDVQDKVNTAMNAFNIVSNMASSIEGLFEQGLDISLKQNELADSNFDRSLMRYAFPYELGQTPQMSWTNLGDKLNPLSDKFDPMAYLAFRKRGNLPREYDMFMNSLQQRATGASVQQLNEFRAQYQDYYNKNLLPKLNDYEQGKIDVQEIEKEMLNYKKTTMEMVPPELRGILEPIVDFLGPFFKFVFKSSKISR